MKSSLGSLLLLPRLLPCCSRTKPSYLLEENGKGDVFVNFVDAKLPDVFVSNKSSSLTGSDYHVIAQQSGGDLAGLIIQKPNQRVRFIGDRTGDGLPDVLILNSKERWEIIASFDVSEPKVKVNRLEPSAEEEGTK